MTPITATLNGTPVTVVHLYGDGYARVQSTDGTLFRNWTAREDPEVAPYPAATDDNWTDVPLSRLSNIQGLETEVNQPKTKAQTPAQPHKPIQ